MCITDPVTAGIMAASSAFVGIMKLQTDYVQSKYQQHQLMEEAKLAQENAGLERQQGIEEARTKKIQAIMGMAEEKSKAASKNIAVSSSTVLNLASDKKLNAELDALNTLSDSERRAANYERRANRYLSQYGLSKYNSKMNTISGLVSISSNATKSFSDIKTNN